LSYRKYTGGKKIWRLAKFPYIRNLTWLEPTYKTNPTFLCVESLYKFYITYHRRKNVGKPINKWDGAKASWIWLCWEAYFLSPLRRLRFRLLKFFKACSNSVTELSFRYWYQLSNHSKRPAERIGEGKREQRNNFS